MEVAKALQIISQIVNSVMEDDKARQAVADALKENYYKLITVKKTEPPKRSESPCPCGTCN